MLPSKIEKIAINNPSNDKRVKLTSEDKESIRREYAVGDTSYNKLALKYGVSKRLIYFVVNPDKQKIAKEQFSERQKDGRYYSKEKHRKYMQDHRLHKKQLYESGMLGSENQNLQK